jgi:hypothetical protein
METWLVALAQLPTGDPTARMRALRVLESLGAAMIREGAYLLPDTPANRDSFDALARDITRACGSAHVLHVHSSSPEQHEAFKRLFDRSARYEELVKTVESLRVGFGYSDPTAISRVLLKQRRDFEAISALDFFPSGARTRAEQAIAQADQAIRKLMLGARYAEGSAVEKLAGRIWATRKPLWADRLACAWLVRRFVDPAAKLVWLDKDDAAPEEALSFGFANAQFPTSEARLAYEEMLTELHFVNNAALGRIGSIVRFLEGRGTPVAEAAGVQTLLQGAMRRAPNEEELIAEAGKTFDLLYEAYLEAPKL